MAQIPGFPIVLTADRLLMADYPVLLDGMTSASQTTSTPDWIMRAFVAPPVSADGVRARKAPLGLRLLESVLRAANFSSEDVAVVPPGHLDRAIGEKTRVVLVSSGDPLGLGMNNSTMSAIAGGKPYTPVWLAEVLRQLRKMKTVFPRLKIVLGGPGAWQVEQHPEDQARLGADVLFSGYAEAGIVPLVRKILDDAPLDPVYKAPPGIVPDIPPLCGPSSMGVVEISRGCGLGCSFCTIRSQPMQHASIEKIVRDVRTNVSGGVTSVCLISEDFLRYGASGGVLAPGRLLEMVRAVRAVPRLQLIQLDHVNISSVARFTGLELRQVHDALAAGVRHDCLWVNLGVESLSGELLAANGCKGKLHPFAPGEWRRVCAESADKLMDAGFMPMISLLLGLPGETEAHLRETLEFVRTLRHKRLTVFPLFFAPVAPGAKSFEAGDMTPLHWELFRLCYSISFRWLPSMYWDNQRGAGVPWLRRAAIQAGGALRMRDWRLRMLWKARRCAKARIGAAHAG